MIEVLVVIAAAFIAIVSSARLTRLLVADSLPPVVWLRIKWDVKTEGSGWNLLFHCHWCMSFWTTTVVVGWGLLAWEYDWELGLKAWWIINGLLAFSYIAAMLVERDEIVRD